jgi:hypothetical protein
LLRAESPTDPRHHAPILSHLEPHLSNAVRQDNPRLATVARNTDCEVIDVDERYFYDKIMERAFGPGPFYASALGAAPQAGIAWTFGPPFKSLSPHGRYRTAIKTEQAPGRGDCPANWCGDDSHKANDLCQPSIWGDVSSSANGAT